MNDLTRPIIGIENRTAQEVFDIMCDRIRASRTQEPDEWQVEFTQPVPPHWSTDEGTEKANEYAKLSRADLAMGDRTDFELANAVYLVNRDSISLLSFQTAAKERIRWLSVQLAKALRAASITPPAPERSKEEVGQNERLNLHKKVLGMIRDKQRYAGAILDGRELHVIAEALLDRAIETEKAALEPASLHKGEDDGSDAAAIEIADAVIAWMVKYDLLDADLEYRDDDIIAVLDDLAPEATPLPVTITPEDGEEEQRIEDLRRKAFRSNDPQDRQAYFDAASKWFQDRHYRYAALSVKPGEQG